MELIAVDGVRLEVRRIGPAVDGDRDRPPIVFLHEGLGSAAMWQSRDGYWPQQLCEATGRAGIVYSRQGYGQSDPVPDVRGPSRTENGRRAGRLLPDYMHREAWEVLPPLLDALGITSPVLLGHSDGASIALLHASRHPVQACIVMAPHVMVEDVTRRSIQEARDAFASSGLSQRLARYHADPGMAFWQWNDVWLSEGFRSFDIRPECRRITAPVLAMQGDADAYGTMAQIGEIAPAGTIERMAIPDCGHAPWRDEPQLCIERITRFLRERTGPESGAARTA